MQRADADEQLAMRVEGIAALPGATAEMARQLDELAASTEEMLRDNLPEQLRHMPVMRLESLERHWRFHIARLENWKAQLQESSGPLLEDAATLTRRRAEWEDERARIAAKELPAVLAGRIDALATDLRRAEERLAGPLAAQLALHQRANDVEARMRRGQSVVTRTIQEIDRRLLHADTLALWDARSLHADEPDMGTSFLQGLRAEAHFAREYGGLDNQRPVVLHTLQLLMLPLLVWMSMRAKRDAALVAGGTASAMFALTRPFSLWLLLSPMVVLVFQPDAPLLVHELAMLVALVPVLRLAPPQERQHLDAWPYLACGLFLLMRLGLLLGGNPFIYRMFLIFLCLLGSSVMLWLAHHLRQEDETAGAWRWRRQVRAAARLGALLLSGAVVANVVGNVSLAETLAAGVIDSGYLALMLSAAVGVCTSLVEWIFKRPTAERERAASFALLLTRLITLGAVTGWLAYSMQRFRIFRPVYGLLASAFSAKFEMGEISISLGNVLVFVVAVFVAFWVAKGVRVLVHDEVLKRLRVSRGLGNSVASLTYYGVLVGGLLMALSAAGFKISELTIVLGALGVGIGFGLQGVVSNFVAGLVLMFERPIQPGDVVDVGTTSGTVGEIGLRATTIRTFDGADVVVPNGSIMASNLVNWTLRDQSRRLEIKIGVAYGTQPDKVAQLLSTTAAQTPGVATQPAPVAFMMELGHGALDFSLRAWTHDADNWLAIRSDMATRVLHALNEAGIEIPFPQQDVHVRTVAPGAELVLGKAG
ncbi:MAG: mechanosensitive ion channel [Proteobacteria bacterium]|nr:mechanosensitive ion channel [Pseudomonadota bacterium]